MEKNHCSARKAAPTSKKNEQVTLIVVIMTLMTMFAEIIAGIISGSMALLSDGIHMGTHALALFITLAAYIFARKQMNNPRYSFGTGKVGVLGGYTNAVLLLLAGFAMAYESVERLIHPVNILFNEAIIVAVIGLMVNIVSAFILGHGDSSHSPGHDYGKGRRHGYRHEDHNLKAAYLHVITDAMTSVLAIFALLAAKFFGWMFMDPLVGILGACVVARWAVGLLRQTSSVLLDKGDFSEEIEVIRAKVEETAAVVKDIHLWQISENERSLILSLESDEGKPPIYYHKLLKSLDNYEHVTVEVNKTSDSYGAL